MNTSTHQSSSNNGYIELQSRLRARLKRAEEIAGQTHFIQRSTASQITTANDPTTIPMVNEDFPPPPPEFLLVNHTSTTLTPTTHVAPQIK
jgi:hypothetical protein